MTYLRIFTRREFSSVLGVADDALPSGDSVGPWAWSVARLIRREVRRKGVVTRRELRRMIEPYLMAAVTDVEIEGVIQGVAERMVEAGELADLKVESQRGYASMPDRWVKLSAHEAVLLGTTQAAIQQHPHRHATQFLRRFSPSDAMIAELDRLGIVQQDFHDWLGMPEWKTFVASSQEIESLGELLDWYINRLDAEGSPLRLDATRILAVVPRPGDFFGSERNPGNSRWASCDGLGDGLYIGAQPGRNQNHWLPLLVRIQGAVGRTIELHCRNNAVANADLRNWLLIALGARNGHKEIIAIDRQANEVQGTFPLPIMLRKILCLTGEATGKWQRYAVTNADATADLLSACVPEIHIA